MQAHSSRVKDGNESPKCYVKYSLFRDAVKYEMNLREETATLLAKTSIIF